MEDNLSVEDGNFLFFLFHEEAVVGGQERVLIFGPKTSF